MKKLMMNLIFQCFNMIRYIKIEDSNKRDAELTFKSINSGVVF